MPIRTELKRNRSVETGVDTASTSTKKGDGFNYPTAKWGQIYFPIVFDSQNGLSKGSVASDLKQ